jgi:hypothetical protein
LQGLVFAQENVFDVFRLTIVQAGFPTANKSRFRFERKRRFLRLTDVKRRLSPLASPRKPRTPQAGLSPFLRHGNTVRDLDHGSSGWHVVLLGHGNIPVSKRRDLSSLRFEQKAPHFRPPECGAFAICLARQCAVTETARRGRPVDGRFRLVIFVTSSRIAVRHDRRRDVATMVLEMTNENRELNAEELGSVSGGGIVDNVLPESEAQTNAFLKQFAEASVRFHAFIISPSSNQRAAVSNQE